jgi:hypothetical protein
MLQHETSGAVAESRLSVSALSYHKPKENNKQLIYFNIIIAFIIILQLKRKQLGLFLSSYINFMNDFLYTNQDISENSMKSGRYPLVLLLVTTISACLYKWNSGMWSGRNIEVIHNGTIVNPHAPVIHMKRDDLYAWAYLFRKHTVVTVITPPFPDLSPIMCGTRDQVMSSPHNN